ncbi:helix-turn-helix domain-containing protein [Microbacterium invictum]|uniref:Excisionase family DNA binding protein n=1 Tax=Microbacterium invictum TaxID=515415 RepID=A0AA40VMF9_9MICO|nr:helix-turn-helix domain-containing protein [Microbacterium invictum]MBB4140401.1 excisionase family DNA binding protein [Microbacterium invictum]
MRFKFVATRVETVERWVRATDEDDAYQKVKEQLERPYAFIGEWECQATEVRIVAAEDAVALDASALAGPGGGMLKLKDAAQALGVSYGTLHKLITRGDIRSTSVGSRVLISREAIDDFIRENTRRGSTP